MPKSARILGCRASGRVWPHIVMPTEQSDAELVAALVGGQSSALATIYDRYSTSLYDTARAMLRDPESTIIDRGGFIFVGLDGDCVAGVCALLSVGKKSYQLAKMAVSPELRGQGTGRRLAEAAIARARERGADEVELFSNTVLGPAISLYRSLGFVEVPLENAEHLRSNIRMVLTL